MAVAMRSGTSGTSGTSGSVGVPGRAWLERGLLAGGIVAVLYYVVANEVVGFGFYPGYDPIARPVSELTATYAPTRPILVPLMVLFDLLMVPFWMVVWRAAGTNRALRLTSGLMLGFRVLALLAYPFPMRTDEVLGANTVHTVIWGVLTPLLMLGGIGASAAAFGKTFRVYAILTLVALVGFSALAGVQAGQINAGGELRWFGLVERALIGVWLQWVVVLAVTLLRAERLAGAAATGRASMASAIRVTPASPATPVARRRAAPPGSAALAFIKRHAVLSYFVLVFAISIGGMLPVIGVGGILVSATPEQFAGVMPYAIPLMLLGPPVAGLLLTGVVAGGAGLREVGARLLRWRVGGRWYAVALLTAPLLYTLLLSALSRFWPEFVPGIAATDDKVSLLLTGLGVGLVGGFVEELGWTGFAIPQLRRRHGVLATGLVVGVLWGAWHVPITFWGTGDASGSLAPLLFLPPFLFYVGVLPAYRVLMVWVHDRTGSVLVAMLMHGSLIASSLFILQPLARGVALSAYYVVLTAALWGLAAVVSVTGGRAPLVGWSGGMSGR